MASKKKQSAHNPIHPLADVDEWERFDQHILERNRLISCKRETEDGYIKTIIQIASAILLLVPGLLNSNESFNIKTSLTIIIGFSFIAISLTTAISEQFLSSMAYKKQIAKTDAYYSMQSHDVSAPRITKLVEISILLSFATFLIGTLIISYSLITNIGG